MSDPYNQYGGGPTPPQGYPPQGAGAPYGQPDGGYQQQQQQPGYGAGGYGQGGGYPPPQAGAYGQQPGWAQNSNATEVNSYGPPHQGGFVNGQPMHTPYGAPTGGGYD
ncbi:hypothetical protein MMC09_004122 [Bachmanniomyces sp. S44760]|nr:hypothetical protein [Bachmanniomyces sp. S44760]